MAGHPLWVVAGGAWGGLPAAGRDHIYYIHLYIHLYPILSPCFVAQTTHFQTRKPFPPLRVEIPEGSEPAPRFLGPWCYGPSYSASHHLRATRNKQMGTEFSCTMGESPMKHGITWGVLKMGDPQKPLVSILLKWSNFRWFGAQYPHFAKPPYGIYKGVALTIGCIIEIHQDLIHSISVYPITSCYPHMDA